MFLVLSDGGILFVFKLIFQGLDQRGASWYVLINRMITVGKTSLTCNNSTDSLVGVAVVLWEGVNRMKTPSRLHVVSFTPFCLFLIYRNTSDMVLKNCFNSAR